MGIDLGKGFIKDASRIAALACLAALALQSVACTRTSGLIIETLGDGSVTVNPSGDTFDPDSTAVLTAHPAAGGAFIGWEGDASGSDNPLSLVMDEDKSVTALFNPVSLGDGQVTISAWPARTLQKGDWALFTLTLSLPAGADYRVWVNPYLPDGYPGDANNVYSSASGALAPDAAGLQRGAVLAIYNDAHVAYAWGSVRQWQLEIATTQNNANTTYLRENFTYPVTWQ